MTAETLARRIRVARGQEAGDLLLTGGSVVNVFTGEVEAGDVVIADGWIAGVGPYEWQAAQSIDITGQFVIPGLIDAHMHMESTLLMPAELARVIVPHGTATVIADPHEIANVLGVGGIELLLEASEGLPVDCFVAAPSCVPASPWERAGATLGSDDLAGLLAHPRFGPRIIGLGEMMNFPGVLNGDGEVLGKIAASHGLGKPVDGHAPGMVGQDLLAYAAAGVRSDHECTTAEEALHRSRLGMLVQVREGSAARNLDTMLPLIVEGQLANWALCTDDIHPEDLVERGHINALVARVVAAGVPAPIAVRHASYAPAQHYRLHDRGAIAPGFRADLVVVPDLERFTPTTVINRGRVVVSDGAYVFEDVQRDVPELNTVRHTPVSEADFRLDVTAGENDVIGIVPDQIVTRHVRRAVPMENGHWRFDPAEDLALIACIHRHEPSGRMGLGLVEGFGFTEVGALASTVAHDAHNLLVTGTSPRDMAVAAEAIRGMGGGFAVVRNGQVISKMALPFAGLMSTESVDEVCRQQAEVTRAASTLGCGLHSPFGTLSFLGLSVIPELRITDSGLFNVMDQRIVR